jgi:hypothetical protein
MSNNSLLRQKTITLHPMTAPSKPFVKGRDFQITVFTFGINMQVRRNSFCIECFVKFDAIGHWHNGIVAGMRQKCGWSCVTNLQFVGKILCLFNARRQLPASSKQNLYDQSYPAN